MRIAIPTLDGRFNGHFGRSAAFLICTVGEDPPRVIDTQTVAVPEGAGCGGIPALLAEHDVGLVLAGGIGAGVVAGLRQRSIEVLAGFPPVESPQALLEQWMASEVSPSGAVCEDHHHGTGHAGHDHGGGCRHGHDH